MAKAWKWLTSPGAPSSSYLPAVICRPRGRPHRFTPRKTRVKKIPPATSQTTTRGQSAPNAGTSKKTMALKTSATGRTIASTVSSTLVAAGITFPRGHPRTGPTLPDPTVPTPRAARHLSHGPIQAESTAQARAAIIGGQGCDRVHRHGDGGCVPAHGRDVDLGQNRRARAVEAGRQLAGGGEEQGARGPRVGRAPSWTGVRVATLTASRTRSRVVWRRARPLARVCRRHETVRDRS